MNESQKKKLVAFMESQGVVTGGNVTDADIKSYLATVLEKDEKDFTDADYALGYEKCKEYGFDDSEPEAAPAATEEAAAEEPDWKVNEVPTLVQNYFEEKNGGDLAKAVMARKEFVEKNVTATDKDFGYTDDTKLAYIILHRTGVFAGKGKPKKKAAKTQSTKTKGSNASVALSDTAARIRENISFTVASADKLSTTSTIPHLFRSKLPASELIPEGASFVIHDINTMSKLIDDEKNLAPDTDVPGNKAKFEELRAAVQNSTPILAARSTKPGPWMAAEIKTEGGTIIAKKSDLVALLSTKFNGYIAPSDVTPGLMLRQSKHTPKNGGKVTISYSAALYQSTEIIKQHPELFLDIVYATNERTTKSVRSATSYKVKAFDSKTGQQLFSGKEGSKKPVYRTKTVGGKIDNAFKVAYTNDAPEALKTVTKGGKSKNMSASALEQIAAVRAQAIEAINKDVSVGKVVGLSQDILNQLREAVAGTQPTQNAPKVNI